MELSLLIEHVLDVLYELGKTEPTSFFDLEGIAEQMQVSTGQLLPAMQYLKSQGLIGGGFTFGGGAVQITPRGILQVEAERRRQRAKAAKETAMAAAASGAPDMRDPTRVFVIQGRNQKAAAELKKFLMAVGLREWTFDEVAREEGNDPSIYNIVKRGVSGTRAVIVLFTPDERAVLQRQFVGAHDKPHDLMRWQARANVLYEAGLARGLNESGLLLVSFGDVELPSDLAGIKIVRLTNDPLLRADLRTRLGKAGCTLNDSNEWMKPELGGNFDPSLVTTGELAG